MSLSAADTCGENRFGVFLTTQHTDSRLAAGSGLVFCLEERPGWSMGVPYFLRDRTRLPVLFPLVLCASELLALILLSTQGCPTSAYTVLGQTFHYGGLSVSSVGWGRLMEKQVS